MKNIVWIASLLFVPIFMGCSPNPASTEFDGVYDGQPFNFCGCHNNVYLMIDHGKVYIYGTHSILHKAGHLEGNHWRIWKGQDIVLTKTQCGLTMQIIGKDSFLEFPRLAITIEEFYKLKTTTTEELSEFLGDWKEPPIQGNGADKRWKTQRKWTDKYGYGPTPNNWVLFDSTVSLSNNTFYVTATYSLGEPIDLVFNPTNFHGRVYIVHNNSHVSSAEIDPYEEIGLVPMELSKKFFYSIDLTRYFRTEELPQSGDILFASMIIDAPIYVLNSKCLVVE